MPLASVEELEKSGKLRSGYTLQSSFSPIHVCFYSLLRTPIHRYYSCLFPMYGLSVCCLGVSMLRLIRVWAPTSQLCLCQAIGVTLLDVATCISRTKQPLYWELVSDIYGGGKRRIVKEMALPWRVYKHKSLGGFVEWFNRYRWLHSKMLYYMKETRGI